MTDEMKLKKYAITVTQQDELRLLAHCMRLYGKIHNIISPSAPKVVKEALMLYAPILENKIGEDVNAPAL